MKAYSAPREFEGGAQGEASGWRAVTEAAPARRRLRAVALGFMAAFLVLGGRAFQLALEGDRGGGPAADAAALIRRADLTDRHGALLAVTAPSFTLYARPGDVLDPAGAARLLAQTFPDLPQERLARRLQSRADTVLLRRGLTERQKGEVLELGLAGLRFEDAARRVYPQGRMGAHALGGVGARQEGVAGVERALDARIRRAGASGRTVRLSLDVRAQYVLEQELARAVAASKAAGGAAIALDGRTGEVLALASAPDFDPNDPPAFEDPRRLNRAVGGVYEMGSVLKPFTLAMGLDAGVIDLDARFEPAPLRLGETEIADRHPFDRAFTLSEGLQRSSNTMAARVALAVGADAQRAALAKLGLFERASVEAPERARPLVPSDKGRVTTAVLGYGYGLSVSVAALAGAYTVFANEGARVAPTLLARERGDAIARTVVFTPETTRAVLAMMRQAVRQGTGLKAEIPGLDIAGKTGSAEKHQVGGYAPHKLLSCFAAIFPAADPRYVLILALDEPDASIEGQGTGGAVAAPAAGRAIARMAPLLGLAPEEVAPMDDRAGTRP